MKRMRWQWTVATVVVLAIIGIFVVKAILKKRDGGSPKNSIDETAVTSFVYYRGGGELGAFNDLALEGNRLTVKQCEGNGSKTYTKNYTVPPDFLEEIQKVIEKSGMKNWKGDFERSDLFVLDGETTSVQISFGDGTTISFDSDLVVPDEGWEAVNKVRSILERIADK